MLENDSDPEGDDIAILCRNTTEAINHRAYRLRLAPDDVVVTTVVEHHANLLPWGRVATRRYVECTPGGPFTVDDLGAAPDAAPPPHYHAAAAPALPPHKHKRAPPPLSESPGLARILRPSP